MVFPLHHILTCQVFSNRAIEYPGQDLLTSALEDKTPLEKVMRAREAARRIATSGISDALNEHKLQAIIAPTDSPISSLASSAGMQCTSLPDRMHPLLPQSDCSIGYPIATVPLGRRNTNGRPFGASIMTRAGDEGTLIRIRSAWEATFPKREMPTVFLGDTSKM